jgi:para-nitrobenzyl esterase
MVSIKNLIIVIVFVAVPAIIIGVAFYLKNFIINKRNVTEGNDAHLLRSTKFGKVLGVYHNNTNNTIAWLGIPYAKPPIGPLRWKAPLDPEPWNTLKATHCGSICTQKSDGSPAGEINGSEDCLYLNIIQKKLTNDELSELNTQNKLSHKKAVMVWIHGGGNLYGSGNDPIFIGSNNLVLKNDIIFVSINYRVNYFGWLRIPGRSALKETNEDKSGNYGLLDIIKALEWLKNNIAFFGGDPQNITVFGNSAGGINILGLIISKKAAGLFQKAIIQSCMPLLAGFQTASEAEEYSDVKGAKLSSKELICQLLVDDGKANNREAAKLYLKKNLASYRDISAYLYGKTDKELLRAADNLGMNTAINRGMPFLIQDGSVIPFIGADKNIYSFLSKPANYNEVNIIMGTNKEEMKLFMFIDPHFVGNLMFLKSGISKTAYNRIARYESDIWKAQNLDPIAESLSKNRAVNVYAYRFDWDEELYPFNTLFGAAHAAELAFVFGSFDSMPLPFRIPFTWSPHHKEMKILSERMMTYWTNFAKSAGGNPGTVNGVAWIKWGQQTKDFIIFDSNNEKNTGIRMASGILNKKEILKNFNVENFGIEDQDILRENKSYILSFMHFFYLLSDSEYSAAKKN